MRCPTTTRIWAMATATATATAATVSAARRAPPARAAAPCGSAGPRAFGQGGARRAVRADPACSRAGGGARRVGRVAGGARRPLRARLPRRGRLRRRRHAQRRRAALKGAYEEAEEEEAAEDGGCTGGYRIASRSARGPSKIPVEAGRDWAWTTPTGRTTGTWRRCRRGHGLARSVGGRRGARRTTPPTTEARPRRPRRDASPSSDEVGGLCFECSAQARGCAAVGARFDEPLTDRGFPR